MTTPLPPQEPEKLPGEAELAALYRKLPQAEPGPTLDRAVLRAASEALANDAASATHPVRRRTRWPVALGSAAALVLVAGLAWRMRDMPSAAPPAVPVPAEVADRSAQPEPDPAMTPPPAPAAPAMAPSPAPRMAAPAPVRQAAAPKASRAKARKAMARPVAKPQAVQQEPPPMPAPPAMMEAAAPAPAPGRLMPAPAPPAAMTTRFAADDPAGELKAIRELFAQGNDEEGRERLVRFHQAHPDFTLPDDLRAHLSEP